MPETPGSTQLEMQLQASMPSIPKAKELQDRILHSGMEAAETGRGFRTSEVGSSFHPPVSCIRYDGQSSATRIAFFYVNRKREFERL